MALQQDPEKVNQDPRSCPVPPGRPVSRASEQNSADHYLVVFEEPHDEGNPIQWPIGKKWLVTSILSATGFNRIVVSTIMAPALPVIAAELHMNATESALSLSIYLLATAFGPLFIGPASEVYGRQVVLHASNVWFLAWNLACGFAYNKEFLIVSRLFAGLGASAIYSLAGGVLGDVWPPDQRGKSLGAYLAIPLIAVAVGPIVGGFITARADWRWMFWATTIFQGVAIVVCFFTYSETYAPVILKRRASRLRRTTGDKQYMTLNERLDRELPLLVRLKRALSRPVRLLVSQPPLLAASVISGFNYGWLYVVLSSFANIFSFQYMESIELSGLHYISCALGEIVGSQLGGKIMDRHYRKMVTKHSEHLPETRLLLVYAPAVLGPLGLLAYGWAAQYRVQWIVVDIGAFTFTCGLQMMGMAVQAYAIDVYTDYTSSALSAMQFLRSLAAFLFPLFAPSLYSSLGYGWGNTLIAFVAIAVGVVLPFLLEKFGARLRESYAARE
ncbi:MFS general substrate transporter [Astrocystis sublimbata]|nr:MFS general substrate transporter [Astrocystis sublimbata]